MTRSIFIERVLRQIYNGPVSDDATITVNLVNVWLDDAIALAAKQNYKDNYQIDGISYVNNGFYTTFKGLAFEADEQFLWKVTLPQIPVGIGANEGISTFIVKYDNINTSFPVIWIDQNQKTYYQSMRPIPNKIIAYSEGENLFLISTLLMDLYTAQVTMISGGDSSDLDSELNVPPDYFPVMVEYIKQQLMFERMQPLDNESDGQDAIKYV